VIILTEVSARLVKWFGVGLASQVGTKEVRDVQAKILELAAEISVYID